VSKVGASAFGELLWVGFDGTTAPPELLDRISAGRAGGVVLFARNVEGPAQVARLLAAFRGAAPANAPPILAVDQEGGRVQRLRAPATEWPPMARLGATYTPYGDPPLATFGPSAPPGRSCIGMTSHGPRFRPRLRLICAPSGAAPRAMFG
jgi:hypothetical protein